MWTDGSQNRATNFALNSGLEGDQCCVKAGKRGWRGEECSALLHGVCQYQVQNYLSAPQHMVAEPGLGALTVRWSHGDDGWVPSSTTVTCCYVKPVEKDNLETKSHKCVDKSVESDTYQVLVDGLETFSEYDITVEAWLDFFNISKTSEFVGRTCKFLLGKKCYQKYSITVPKEDVRWSVSLDGKLSVTWLSGMSLYEEDNAVGLLWAVDEESGNSSGTVRMTSVNSLSLGKTYNITLVDLEVGNIATSFNFVACKLLCLISRIIS